MEKKQGEGSHFCENPGLQDRTAPFPFSPSSVLTITARLSSNSSEAFASNEEPMQSDSTLVLVVCSYRLAILAHWGSMTSK